MEGEKKLWLSWKNKFGKEVFFTSLVVVDIMLLFFIKRKRCGDGGRGGMKGGRTEKNVIKI